MTKLCQKCYGTGQWLGNGMMIIDCNCTDDDSYKGSSYYEKAIDDIMALDDNITRDDAEQMFDDSYNSDNGVSKNEKKRSSRRK